MAPDKTNLLERIASGQPIVLAEITPPKTADADLVRATAGLYAGKVHALEVSDNRDGACIAALAAASIIASAGVEPVLHMVTRDRNRISLISNCLGAAALGVRNVLCTTGTHQTLGASAEAKNVFDIDPIQLIQAATALSNGGSPVAGEGVTCSEPLCLGAVAAPFADPMELQVLRLAKKAAVGAKFLITQPVFDIERFKAWWAEVQRQGTDKATAIVAGIRILKSADDATAFAAARPSPCVPQALVDRVTSAAGSAAQRQAGIDIAVETIRELSAIDGLRGFSIRGEGDDEAALEVIEKAGLKVD